MKETNHVIPAEADTRIQNQDRRTILQYLVSHQKRSISLDELAHVLAGAESPRRRTNQEAPERYAMALRHCHLPKLDEMNLIHYNPQCQTAIFPLREQDGVAVEVE